MPANNGGLVAELQQLYVTPKHRMLLVATTSANIANTALHTFLQSLLHTEYGVGVAVVCFCLTHIRPV